MVVQRPSATDTNDAGVLTFVCELRTPETAG